MTECSKCLKAIQDVCLNVFVFSFCHETCKDLAQPERPIYNVMEVVLLGFEVGPIELHEEPVMRLDERFQNLCESSSCCWPRSQYTDDVPESAETLAFCGEMYVATKMFEQQDNHRHHR